MAERYLSHPAAELFPLMGEDELQALADDIKANGLRQPIVLDGDGRILDGRNRLAACGLAGVEPRFEPANGADPLALVVSLNVKRRNLTAGQRAVAAAEAWDKVSHGSRDKPKKERLAEMFGVAENYVQRARSLDDDLRALVKAGMKLSEAQEKQIERKQAADELAKREAERARIREEHGDLFEELERDDITWDEAVLEIQQREQQRKQNDEDEAQSRRIHTRNLVQAVDLLQLHTDDERIDRDIQRLDPAELPTHWNRERLARAVTYLTKFYERSEHGS